MFITLIILLVLTIVVWYILNLDKAGTRRRAEIMAQPFPDTWKTVIGKSVPLTRKLPEKLKNDLYKKVLAFFSICLSQKRFIPREIFFLIFIFHAYIGEMRKEDEVVGFIDSEIHYFNKSMSHFI